jgi:uncharacterized BrkB/YihY/UPF0761 family membrane protein
MGAAVTAVLFTIGKSAIGFYLGWNGTTSPFGAAGSLEVILVWVYYLAQIILFGAVFMRVLSVECGERVVPAENTVRQPPVPARKNRRRPALREIEHVEVGVDVLTAKQPDSFSTVCRSSHMLCQATKP